MDLLLKCPFTSNTGGVLYSSAKSCACSSSSSSRTDLLGWWPVHVIGHFDDVLLLHEWSWCTRSSKWEMQSPVRGSSMESPWWLVWEASQYIQLKIYEQTLFSLKYHWDHLITSKIVKNWNIRWILTSCRYHLHFTIAFHYHVRGVYDDEQFYTNETNKAGDALGRLCAGACCAEPDLVIAAWGFSHAQHKDRYFQLQKEIQYLIKRWRWQGRKPICPTGLLPPC